MTRTSMITICVFSFVCTGCNRGNKNSTFADYSDRISMGMRMSEVVTAIGEPTSRQILTDDRIHEAWRYRLDDNSIFQINFDKEGIVIGHQIDNPSGRW